MPPVLQKIIREIHQRLRALETREYAEVVGPGSVINAQYLTLALHAVLTAERRFVDGDGLVGVDGGANADYTLNARHVLLSTSHTDTLAAAVVDGDVIIGNITPRWSRLAIAVPAANVRNVLGIDNAELRPSWKTALDNVNPADIAGAAAPGVSLIFSHRDHVHNHPAGLGVNLHHNEVHVVNSTGPHAEAGLTIGHVLRASAAAAFAFAQLQHGDLGGVGVNDHHTQIHNVVGADHTLAGAQWSLVGATALNTIGLLTPSDDVSAGVEAILKSTAAGWLSVHTIRTSAGAVGTPSHTFVGDPDTGLYSYAANELGIATGGAHRAHWNTTGAVVLNDAAASTFMTGPGVTIQQGVYVDEAVALQGTDVAHGLTTIADTNTYGTLRKAGGAQGGVSLSGFRDSGSSQAITLRGYLAADADTTKTTAGRAIVEVHSYIRDAGTPTQVGNTNADGNAFGVRTRRGGADVTLLLVDEDGDCYELGDEYLTGSHRQSVSVGVRVYRDAAFVHNNTGNFLPIDFNQQRWDDPDDDQWVIGTPTHLTCQFDGIYVISGHADWVGNATGRRILGIYLNGTLFIAMAGQINLNADTVQQTIATTYKLTVGDFVELLVYQNSGGNLNVNSSGNYSPEFSMVRIA